MAALITEAPQSLRHHFARAKSLLKRNDTIRALDSLLTGLDLYTPTEMLAKARFDVESLIYECVMEIGRQPDVRKLLQDLGKKADYTVRYRPKEEAQLKKVLMILRDGLKRREDSVKEAAAAARNERKQSLQDKGLNYLKIGDTPRGKSALRLLVEEFGEEPGMITQVAAWLQEAGLLFEAVEFYEQSIELFPRDGTAYAGAASAYLELQEYEKCETVYKKALKEFGKHPRTLLNLAKMYVAWNKRDDAFINARDAYSKDESLTEAKEIMDKCS